MFLVTVHSDNSGVLFHLKFGSPWNQFEERFCSGPLGMCEGIFILVMNICCYRFLRRIISVTAGYKQYGSGHSPGHGGTVGRTWDVPCELWQDDVLCCSPSTAHSLIAQSNIQIDKEGRITNLKERYTVTDTKSKEIKKYMVKTF